MCLCVCMACWEFRLLAADGLPSKGEYTGGHLYSSHISGGLLYNIDAPTVVTTGRKAILAQRVRQPRVLSAFCLVPQGVGAVNWTVPGINIQQPKRIDRWHPICLITGKIEVKGVEIT